jgi:hypothetical protein
MEEDVDKVIQDVIITAKDREITGNEARDVIGKEHPQESPG